LVVAAFLEDGMSVAASNRRRVAVIGGGLSGMAAALRVCDRAKVDGVEVDVHLYESGDRLGGLVSTERVGPYVIERGADSFITNKPGAINLCRRLGLESELIPTDSRFRGSLILKDGVPLPTPEGFNLLVPGNLWAVLTSPLLSVAGKVRCLEEFFIPARATSHDESLAEFTRRRLGSEILDRIVQPLVGGIYTSDPEQLSLMATLPRFVEMERKYGGLIKSAWRTRKSQPDAEREAAGARYGLFMTLRDGMSQLIGALADEVRRVATIHLNSCVTSVTTKTDCIVELAFDQRVEQFDAVICAVSAYATANLIDQSAPELSGLLRQIPYASSAIVVSGHNLADIRHPLDSFGLVIPHVERRKILAVSFLNRKFPQRAPEGKAILRTFVGGAMQPELLELNDDELRHVVREELRELLGVGGEPDFEVVTRYSRAMPQYHVGHLDLVRRVREAASAVGGFHLAGNAYDGVGIPDTIQSGEMAAEQLLRRLVTPTTADSP
jgi:oxygen-dependent protoporphyrinogen oxidase